MNRLTILMLLFFPAYLFSQQKMEGALFGGFANYQGDLVKDPIALSETKVSYGGFLRYHLTRKVKVRGNFMYAFISGNDANNTDPGFQARGWSFESNILEATLIGEYHPLDKGRISETGIFDRQISPYVGVGLGLASFTPKVSVSDTKDADLFPEQDEKSSSLSLPLIVGVRADLFEYFSLGLEVGWRATFNDYLDGVSQNGNPDRNDWYVIGGFTLSYFFGDLQPDNFAPKN